MDPSEPRWRMNSSFSPPVSRRWDCRYQSDGLPHRVHDAQLHGSSVSSHSKGSRSRFGSDQYLNHHHSISDGAISDLGSSFENIHAPPRWTPSLRRLDLGEFSTPSGGARPETSVCPWSSERHFTTGSSASPIESSRWASTSKRPIFVPPRNISGRRSFMSKPVYPLVFRNPVSEAEADRMPETSDGGRMTAGADSLASPASHESPMSSELKLHKALDELRKMEDSPEPSTSSRREGFRWSNSSSYDFGYDGDAIDITEDIGIESQIFPTNSVRYERCGFCERLMWQKSPWSSNRIVRSSDMPIAGVLPCGHVFHAECLEETTPKNQIHEPPCPLCLRVANDEGAVSFSEPLQVALRSDRRLPGSNIASSSVNGTCSFNSSRNEETSTSNQSLPLLRRGGSLMRCHFKKQFSSKSKIGKDLFGAKVFKKFGSSSLSRQDNRDQSPQSRTDRSFR